MLDLQPGNTGLTGIVGLQTRDHAAPLIAQLPHAVEVSVISGGYKAAVTRQERQIGG